MAIERPFGGDAGRLGLYGFGAAAHLLAQVAVAEGRQVHAFTRTGRSSGAGTCATAGRGVGRRLRRAAAGAARRGNPLRSGGCAGAVGASRGAPGRRGNLRGHPHERHPVVPIRAALAGARRAFRGQPDARRRRRLSRRGRPRPAPSRYHLGTPSRTPTPLWTTCGTGACREPPCSSHDVPGPAIHSPAARRVPCRSRWRWAPRRWWSC